MADNNDIMDKLENLGPETSGSERMHQMKKLMRQLYKEETKSHDLRLPPIKSQNLVLFFSITSILVFGVTTLYNFNRFVSLEEQVLSSEGHIEDALQRRANLMGNLVNLALNQAVLEQEVFRHVADVRSGLLHQVKPGQAGLAAAGSEGSAPAVTGEPAATAAVEPQVGGTEPAPVDGNTTAPGSPGDKVSAQPQGPESRSTWDKMVSNPAISSLSRLLAVVEQYPDIKASSTYQVVMDKLVEIENRIAMRRDEYNEQVRIFNTLISSFPWYLLAKITGFTRYEYFRSGDKLEAQIISLDTGTFNRLLPIMKMKRTPPLPPSNGSHGQVPPKVNGTGLSGQGEQ